MTLTAEPQPMVALAVANRVRLARGALKRRVILGEVSAAEVILDCPWEAEKMAIFDLLLCQRAWGTGRVCRFLVMAQVPESKQLGALTVRQRRVLAERLGGGR